MASAALLAALPAAAPRSAAEMEALEAAHRVADLFVWLAFRLPAGFEGRARAEAARAALSARIEEGLAALGAAAAPPRPRARPAKRLPGSKRCAGLPARAPAVGVWPGFGAAQEQDTLTAATGSHVFMQWRVLDCHMVSELLPPARGMAKRLTKDQHCTHSAALWPHSMRWRPGRISFLSQARSGGLQRSAEAGPAERHAVRCRVQLWA